MKNYIQKKPFEWRYKWFWGSFAWALHRISGLALIFYLCIHLYIVNRIAVYAANPDQTDFNRLMGLMQSTPLRVAEVFLFAAFVYHAINGLRVVWMDLGGGSLFHKKLFAGVMVLAAVVCLAGAAVMLNHAFH
jgi:succinate dehydrogenase / fumarate reductase cytochrome b subunit